MFSLVQTSQNQEGLLEEVLSELGLPAENGLSPLASGGGAPNQYGLRVYPLQVDLSTLQAFAYFV